MPSQMFTRITATNATSGEVSHGIGASMIPRFSRVTLRMPLSCSRIARQAALPTISGSSHGSRNSARRTPLSGKFLWKNSASSMPITNWPTIDPMVNSAVLVSALVNSWSVTTAT